MITEIGKSKLGSNHTAIKMWRVCVESGKRELREHRHINFEIALVINGSGIYHTPKGIKTIEKDNIFVFASNEPHCIIDVGADGLELLNLHFSSKLIDCNPILDNEYPYIFYNHSKEFDCKITKSQNINNILLKLREEFNSMHNGYQCVISGIILELFVELIRNHNYYLKEDNPNHSIITKLEKGIEYINAHYCDELTLEMIAEKSSITPNYFSALFKKCLNMNLWEYITTKRIDKAKRLLTKQEGLNVLDIAVQCGYNNTANFNRAFKLYAGITPSQYRKNRFENII